MTAVLLTESGTGSDVLSVTVSAPLADSGVGADSLVVPDHYTGVILADGPSVYYRLGEISGSAHAYNGMGVNAGIAGTGPTYGVTGAIAGDSDTAASFDGTGSNYVHTAGTPGPAYDLGDGPFSIEFWYKLNAINAAQNPLGKGASAYLVRLSSTNNWSLRVDAHNACFVTTAAFADMTSWHHFVATRASGTQPHIYIDGVDQAGTYTAQTFANVTANFTMGVDSATPATGAFNGALDEVALYQSALSAAQVLAHYTAGTTVLLADSGTGADTLGESAAVPLSESALAADVINASAAVPITDSAVGSDALAESAIIQVTDSGAGTDAISESASVPLADSGTGTDSLAESVAIFLSDIGGGVDILAWVRLISLADAGNASDSITVSAAVPLADTGMGDDEIVFRVIVLLALTAGLAGSVISGLYGGTLAGDPHGGAVSSDQLEGIIYPDVLGGTVTADNLGGSVG